MVFSDAFGSGHLASLDIRCSWLPNVTSVFLEIPYMFHICHKPLFFFFRMLVTHFTISLKETE